MNFLEENEDTNQLLESLELSEYDDDDYSSKLNEENIGKYALIYNEIDKLNIRDTIRKLKYVEEVHILIEFLIIKGKDEIDTVELILNNMVSADDKTGEVLFPGDEVYRLKPELTIGPSLQLEYKEKPTENLINEIEEKTGLKAEFIKCVVEEETNEQKLFAIETNTNGYVLHQNGIISGIGNNYNNIKNISKLYHKNKHEPNEIELMKLLVRCGLLHRNLYNKLNNEDHIINKLVYNDNYVSKQ